MSCVLPRTTATFSPPVSATILMVLLAGAMIPKVGYVATALTLVFTGLVLTLVLAVTWRDDLIRRDAIGNAI